MIIKEKIFRKKWARKKLDLANSKIQNLFGEIRKVATDGNSFFRSVGFCFLENMLMESNLSSLLDFLMNVLPYVILVIPNFEMSAMTIKIVNYDQILKSYLIAELVELAEACIKNIEKSKESSCYENSALLENKFNNDKFFDLAVVMLMRTMLYYIE